MPRCAAGSRAAQIDEDVGTPLHRLERVRPVSATPDVRQDQVGVRYALRQAEMSLWLEIQKTAMDECPPAPEPSLGRLFAELSTNHQKRELAMLLILVGAAVMAVTVAFQQATDWHTKHPGV